MSTPRMPNPGVQPDRQRRTAVEALLGYPRAVLVAVLVLTTSVSWAWIVLMARDMYGSMRGPAAVMMAGMMLPSAGPILLLYAGAVRQRSGAPRAALRVYALTAGYLAVWSLFSVGATLLQRMLMSSSLLTPMMEPATPIAGAAVL